MYFYYYYSKKKLTTNKLKPNPQIAVILNIIWIKTTTRKIYSISSQKLKKYSTHCSKNNLKYSTTYKICTNYKLVFYSTLDQILIIANEPYYFLMSIDALYNHFSIICFHNFAFWWKIKAKQSKFIIDFSTYMTNKINIVIFI